MTVGTRTFPVPRMYQTWLRELAPTAPRRLWFSHLLVHRLEALVTVVSNTRLEPFPLALLRRLFPAPNATVAVTELERFHFDRQLAAPLLRDCAAAGLLQLDGSGWTLTASGRQALQTGDYTRRIDERRVFYFADNSGATPSYLPLTQTAGPVANGVDSWTFSPAILEECLRRPVEWRKAIRFPLDVEALNVEPRNDWRQVILDRAEHAPLLWVECAVADGSSLLVGYLVRSDNWAIQRDPPALVLGAGWPNLLPDFAEGLAPAAWREAWLVWCQARQLPSEEIALCRIDYGNCRLSVKAPKVLVERLKAARNEVLRGETWLTIGTGRTRAAACVEVRELE